MMSDEKINDTSALPLSETVYKKTEVYRRSVTVLAVICAAVYFCTLYFSLEPDIGYYRTGALLPIFFTILLCVSAVCALSSRLLIPRGAVPRRADYTDGLNFCAASFFAFMSLFEGVYRIGRLVSLIKSNVGTASFMTPDETRLFRVKLTVSILFVITSLGAVAYFFKRSRGEGREKALVMIFGVLATARNVCGLATVYFDMELAMNSPVKIVSQLSSIFLMIFFLYDIRWLLPEENARPEGWFAAALVALIFSAVSSIPVFAAYMLGKVTNPELPVSSLYCFTAFIYILARLSGYVRSIRDPSFAGVPSVQDDDGDDGDDESPIGSDVPDGENANPEDAPGEDGTAQPGDEDPADARKE